MTRSRHILAILVLPLLACSDPTGSDPNVRVTLAVDQSVLRPTDTTRVTVSITNQGARPVTIVAYDCPERFVVRNPSGTIVAPSMKWCPLPLGTKQLAPAEAHVFQHSWSPTDVRGSGPLPAGRYYLQGVGGVAGEVVESPPVEIRVEDPAAVKP